MKRIVASMITVASLAAFTTNGAEPVKTSPAQASLGAVPAPELPARAAELVKQAKASKREVSTIDVTRAAVGINPASAPAIVGAIARGVPRMAGVSAAVAAAEQPAQAVAIARAAAAASPEQAGEIVVAVCQAVPNQYREVAVAVSQAAPGSSRQVLKSVGKAIPQLRPGIEQALAGMKGAPISVASTLDSVKPVAIVETTSPVSGVASTPSTAARPRGPAVAPPYVAPSGTPAAIDPLASGPQPTGGRNYARP